MPSSPLSAARKALLHRGSSRSPRKGGKGEGGREEGERNRSRTKEEGGEKEQEEEEEEEEEDPFHWSEGVPDHWMTTTTTRGWEGGREGGMVSLLAAAFLGEGEGGGEEWEVWETVLGKLVGLLLFCALLFVTLFLRAQVF